MTEETARRLADLEQRVAALEDEGSGDRAEPGPDAGGGAEPPARFWVLDGLRPQVSGSGAVVYGGLVTTGHGPVEWQYGHMVDDLLADPDEDGVEHHAEAASRIAALGHPARLAILGAVLRGHDRTAELADLLDLGTSGQVYHHVKALSAAGWLRSTQRGRVSVPAERVVPLLVVLGAGR